MAGRDRLAHARHMPDPRGAAPCTDVAAKSAWRGTQHQRAHQGCRCDHRAHHAERRAPRGVRSCHARSDAQKKEAARGFHLRRCGASMPRLAHPARRGAARRGEIGDDRVGSGEHNPPTHILLMAIYGSGGLFFSWPRCTWLRRILPMPQPGDGPFCATAALDARWWCAAAKLGGLASASHRNRPSNRITEILRGSLVV
jgi:hypothetical protein